MFSKALFKQSCKANGTSWSIITFAVCFMLACVMLISGSGNIGETKNAIEDTIIEKEVESSVETRAINYFSLANDGIGYFDSQFVAAFDKTEFSGKVIYYVVTESLSQEEAAAKASSELVPVYYAKAVENVVSYMNAKALAIDPSYTAESAKAKEMLGAVIFAINPELIETKSKDLYDAYIAKTEDVLPDYDVASLVKQCLAGTEADYIKSLERTDYVETRAERGSAQFIALNLTLEENVQNMVDGLSGYGVSREKYDSFGFTYDYLKDLSRNTVITYSNRFNYEKEKLAADKEAGKFESEEAYLAAVKAKNEELVSDVAGSLLASLPQEVSDALKEVGKMDLYTLIVGSIFYKLAGLLLPIIFMIMASNSLIAGQVDSGSMAYVLSTSTKRSTVVFTQAVYLIGSLLAMFALTTATGCVCLAIITEDVSLSYGKLVLLNLGAFLVLLALSGLCFFTSCVFDRSKRSMAIGGGLSIFALVAAMLGLFGSPVIPSVVRLDALNNFNYTTIISLFDVISIMESTSAFVWKFAILAVLGIVGYIAGSVIFTKKDLPL